MQAMKNNGDVALTRFQVIVVGKIISYCEEKNLPDLQVFASIRPKFDEAGTYVDITCNIGDYSLWIYYDGAGLSNKAETVDERFERPAFKSDEDMATDILDSLGTHLI